LIQLRQCANSKQPQVMGRFKIWLERKR